MQKKYLASTTLAITCIILIGFVLMTVINYNAYSRVIQDDVKNISKLTSSSIYAQIDRELTKPIYVSLTMANDTFLKEWLAQEIERLDTPQDIVHQERLHQYLLGFQEKYGYNSVFLVSSASNRYYHYEKLHKTISSADAHDVWYYRFIQSGKAYDLDVDLDEADQNRLTVFVNCRVQDETGKLLGVVGVGVKMHQLQELLGQFERDYQLEAFLVKQDGVMQVHTNDTYIENVNIFDRPMVGMLKEKILSKETHAALNVYWYPGESGKYCLSTRYIDQLDWYLMVIKDTDKIRLMLYEQLAQDIWIAAAIILVLVFLSAGMIRRYETMMIHLVSTDELTHLPNRRAFNKTLQTLFARQSIHAEQAFVFIFDVDQFKRVNDTYGHLFGDKMLVQISELTRKLLPPSSTIARWGGDEFIGIIYGRSEEMLSAMKALQAEMDQTEVFISHHISISAGIARLEMSDNVDTLLARADQMLYQSKKNDGNHITFSDK